MNYIELEYMMAWAECYGYQQKSVEWVANEAFNDPIRVKFFEEEMNEPNYPYDYEERFVDCFKAIKESGLTDECFTLMRFGGYTIWQAAMDWDII